MSEDWSKALTDLKNLGRFGQGAARPVAKDGSHPGALSTTEAGTAPLRWTQEQQHVIDSQAVHLRARALAGTGKSQVLEAYARRRRGKWQYLTFNQALARAAKTAMPSHVRVNTFHAMAFAHSGHLFQQRFERVWKPGDLNQILRQSWPEDVERRWLRVLLNTQEAFIRSAEPIILAEHVDRTSWLMARACGDDVAMDMEGVIADAERLWGTLTDPGAPWPVTHDVYLKLWCLASPKLPVDGILVDEDQDLTPAVHAWFAQHAGHHVRVGDPYQAIYGFRGAVVRADQEGEAVFTMPHSFRFGAAIAATANQVLQRLGDDRLIGQGPEGSVSTHWRTVPQTVLLGRTHAGVLEAALEASEQGIALSQSLRLPQRLTDLLALHRGNRDLIRDPWVRGFGDFDHLKATVAETEDRDWQALCRLVTRHGDRLEQRIERLNAQQQPDGWKTATVHAAKGQTFERVALAQDLPLADPRSVDGEEEAHLLYVAMTRARTGLDLHPIWAEAFQKWARQAAVRKSAAELDDSGF